MITWASHQRPVQTIRMALMALNSINLWLPSKFITAPENCTLTEFIQVVAADNIRPHTTYSTPACKVWTNMLPALHPQASLLPHFNWNATHQRGSRHFPTLFLSKHTENCHKHGWPSSMNPTELPGGSVTTRSSKLQCKLQRTLTEFPKSCRALGCSSENQGFLCLGVREK